MDKQRLENKLSGNVRNIFEPYPSTVIIFLLFFLILALKRKVIPHCDLLGCRERTAPRIAVDMEIQRKILGKAVVMRKRAVVEESSVYTIFS